MNLKDRKRRIAKRMFSSRGEKNREKNNAMQDDIWKSYREAERRADYGQGPTSRQKAVAELRERRLVKREKSYERKAKGLKSSAPKWDRAY